MPFQAPPPFEHGPVSALQVTTLKKILPRKSSGLFNYWCGSGFENWRSAGGGSSRLITVRAAGKVPST